MTREYGKISKEDLPKKEKEEKEEEREMNIEATAFCNGFAQGFMISFDGWNGQVFKEFNRPVLESEIFRKKMNEKFSEFMEIMEEMKKMMEFETGIPPEYRGDKSKLN